MNPPKLVFFLKFGLRFPKFLWHTSRGCCFDFLLLLLLLLSCWSSLNLFYLLYKGPWTEPPPPLDRKFQECCLRYTIFCFKPSFLVWVWIAVWCHAERKAPFGIWYKCHHFSPQASWCYNKSCIHARISTRCSLTIHLMFIFHLGKYHNIPESPTWSILYLFWILPGDPGTSILLEFPNLGFVDLPFYLGGVEHSFLSVHRCTSFKPR